MHGHFMFIFTLKFFIEMIKRIINISFCVVMLLITQTVFVSYSNNNASKMANNSVNGCSCHGLSNAATIITVLGLPLVTSGYTPGFTYPVSVIVSNPGKIAAGINLSTNIGTISNLGTGLTALNSSAVRHTNPKIMSSGSATFTFDWTAPTTNTTTLQVFACANATNANGNTSGDTWNNYNLTVPLFVEFLSLHSVSKPNQILLNWETSTEDKIKYFAVEKSTDGNRWDSIGVVYALGGFGIGKKYNFADYPQYSGDYLYRLKIVSEAVGTSWSKTEKVSFDNGARLEMVAFPNPSNYNQPININVFNNKSSNLTVRMHNMQGVEVYRFNYKANRGTNYFTIPNQLSSGVYKISVLPEIGTGLEVKQVIR